MHSSILRRILLNFIVQYLFCFFTSLNIFHFFRISNFFGLSTTEETFKKSKCAFGASKLVLHQCTHEMCSCESLEPFITVTQLKHIVIRPKIIIQTMTKSVFF
jgi:hypothetical protein